MICTSVFSSNSIAALHCGHTFHFVCISKWVERSKTCPICRVVTAERHIVKHLFFDSADDVAGSQAPGNSTAQIEALSIALEQEKSDHFEAKEEVLRLKTSLESLQVKFDLEKKCFREKIPSLQTRNRQLEMMLVDQQELQRTLEATRRRLRACDFYKAITIGKDETALDKYLKEDGAIEHGQFLNILRRQLDEARRTQSKLKDELRAERELVRTLKKKEHDLKNIVAALEKELRDVRSATNMSSLTPFNPKLKKLALENSPPKRESFGFNESVEINDDVLGSALRHRPKQGTLQTKAGTSTAPQPLFYDSSDDEERPTDADVSLQYPGRLDTIPSPRVPKTMRERVLAGSKNSHPTGFGGAQGPAAKALAELEFRNISGANMIRRRPVLKRKADKDEAKNQRLSQFFLKKLDPMEVIDL